MKPIIILAFSNSQDAYLDNIKLEREATTKALADLNDADVIGVRQIAHLSNEQLFYYLNRYRNQIRIFHYAGHANGTTLQLEGHGGDELAHSEGIAGLLGQCNTLDLVFLNGCATYGQVETLLAKGVKAVIATSVAINDTKAYKFSIKFYETLATGETIGKAFDAAKSVLQLGNAPDIQQRGLKLKRENKSETIPWGIYTKEGNEAALNQKLPTQPFKYIVPKEDKAIYEPNANLAFSTFMKARKHSKSIRAIYRKAQKDGEDLPLSDYQNSLLDNLPAIISTQLRELFSVDLPMKSHKHLQQLVHVYQSILITIGNSFLAALWDAVKKDKLQLNPKQKQIIEIYFNQNAFNHQSFDWLLLIDTCLAALKSHFNLTHLELREIPKTPFYHIISHFFPNGLRQNKSINEANEYLLDMLVQNKSADSEKISVFCKNAETYLTNVFQALSILTRFKMTVVKKIQINKFKYSPVSYNHQIVPLNYNLSESVLREGDKILPEPTETSSIQFFQNDFSKGINLFPFVIDKHSFKKALNSKTYFFAYRKGHDELIYRFLDNWEETFSISIQPSIDTYKDKEANIYNMIAQQFYQAKADILNQKNEFEQFLQSNEEDEYEGYD